MVERRDRAGVTTFFADGAFVAGTAVSLPDAAAHHARVKRLAAGEPVQLTNGAGTLAGGTIARVAKNALEVDVHDVRTIAPPSPIELYAPVGDRERMLWLAEKATELGISAWRPVIFHRSRSVSPRGEGEAFASKVRARMIGALEQSGGAWLPTIHGELDVASAASHTAMPVRLLLDAAGGRLDAGIADRGAAVILGPEGGLEANERDVLLGAGWRPVSLAGNILRFETAGVAAVAVLRAATITPEPSNR